MSIVTQCPSCSTTFRVTPPQLQAQHGMVRCGRCAQVFDGFKTLATLPEAPPEVVQQEAARDIEPEITPVSEAAATVAEPPAAPPPAVSPPAVPPPLYIASVSVEPSAPAPPRVNDFEPRPFEQSAAAVAPTRRRKFGWAFGIALMLCGLAAQGAYFYRSDIAASLPEARPHLNKMCELLRCTVALPQRPRQISIEASDMQAPDPANPGQIALTATLRNHATTELGYPALDVVLTNTKEHTVARRIFVPAEYLVAGRDPRAGIAPNAEVTIRLDLDTGDLGAAGFRLDLIAAPAR